MRGAVGLLSWNSYPNTTKQTCGWTRTKELFALALQRKSRSLDADRLMIEGDIDENVRPTAGIDSWWGEETVGIWPVHVYDPDVLIASVHPVDQMIMI